MERVLATVMLGGALCIQALASPAGSGQAAVSAAAIKPDKSGGPLTDVPPLPRGKSTILGGSIQDVDPVRVPLMVLEVRQHVDERMPHFRR